MKWIALSIAAFARMMMIGFRKPAKAASINVLRDDAA
jgi:hypothetical protein